MVIANYKVTVISSCKLQVASFCSGVSARMTPGGTAVFVGCIALQLYRCTAVFVGFFDVQAVIWPVVSSLEP